MARVRPDFEEAWRRLFDPRAIIPFLLGSVTLGMLSNGVYELVTGWVGHSPARVGVVVLGTFLIFGVSVSVFAWTIITPAGPIRFEKRRPEKHRGLILLVSQEAPCRKAVSYHSGVLERCWLLCSTKTLEMANGLRREFMRDGIQVPEPIVVNDVNDPKEYCDRILAIFNALPEGWQASDVIADYLGMTSHASVGVVLAWHNGRFPLQYTLPVFDGDRRPIGVDDPIEISLSRDDGAQQGSVLGEHPSIRPPSAVDGI